MTTNITALVQRLKVAAKNGCCHTIFPDDCLALVEALEEEQAENAAGVDGMAESYETTISMLRSRIAELQSRSVLPDELSVETLLDVASITDLVYSDDTGILEYTNINGCFVKVTAPPDKVIRFRCSNKRIYMILVDRVKTHEHAGIIVDFPKNL